MKVTTPNIIKKSTSATRYGRLSYENARPVFDVRSVE